MNLLIDTHAFLWFITSDQKLSPRARKHMEDPASELFLSIASVWEMAIKVSLKHLPLPEPFDEFIANNLESGFHLLPIECEHASLVSTLPYHHRDPFDRMIVAQALKEEMPLVTTDLVFRAYRAKVIW